MINFSIEEKRNIVKSYIRYNKNALHATDGYFLIHANSKIEFGFNIALNIADPYIFEGTLTCEG